ncbi:Cysteine protease ATG4 [Grifola frondosa]|uniref:Cysteine protease n=1 Tax=Grifola frondosa TaxID=5627 RepID=A0A1C7MRZ4_GRIFR|nr:Cysteine protease ATG4 [Grifola frondosa]
MFKDRGEKRRQSQDIDSPDIPKNGDHDPDDTPVIVEPVNIPRARTRSERPLSDNYSSVNYYSSSSSNTRLTDIPTRLSGWFSHTFSSSTNDLSLPSLLSQQQLNASVSPKGKGSALLTAARHGKGHLDKAMRYLLDSDATPDKCPDPIWLLGVQHPGYEPAPTPAPDLDATVVNRRGSVGSRRSPSSFRSSTSSSPVTPNNHTAADPSLSQSQPPSSFPANKDKDPSKHWPPVFTPTSPLEAEIGENVGTPSSPQPKKWNWPLGGEKGWTSDAGWGCMLRTGQSLLANTLLHLHLGRDWRRPPYPIYTADYATYVQIITWFLDSPSPLCPFSVHRMALVGKDLGKDVGQWFGPSTAAGAIKTLVHAFPEAGLGVALAVDNVLYESDVFVASRSSVSSPRSFGMSRWGDRAVLILVGARLGLDGVTPVYYDVIKTLFTFPQSVGIAGGRPSSSYYFVGSQADTLFYLDPHHARPAIPLRTPPHLTDTPPLVFQEWDRHTAPETPYTPGRERERDRNYRILHHTRSPTSPVSVRSVGSSASYRSPPAVPSPLQQQMSTSSASTSQSSSQQSHVRWQSSSALPDDPEMDSRELGLGMDLDPLQRHFVATYSAAELKTFHCDRVRKMPLSGLDPSMLLGFLCKDENDWNDFRQRMNEVCRNHKKAMVFSISEEEHPSYQSDLETNLESISEPDIDMPDDDEFSDGNSHSASPDTSIQGISGKSEVDTEEDPIDPLTPGGKPSFDLPDSISREASVEDSISFDDEEDEEWLDPAEFTPQQPVAPPLAESRSSSSATSRGTGGSAGKHHRKSKKSSKSSLKAHSTQQQVQVQYPFPATYPGEEVLQYDASKTGKRVPQMRTAKARDGGRTQSGGVRGVPTDDADDF